MAEQKDFNSLDDLFRKTFDDLPDSSSATGWDTPSERVWQHVQARMKPPRQGWTSGQLLLIASAAIGIALGLYFALSRPKVSATEPTAVTEQINPAPTPESTAAPLDNSADAAPNTPPQSTLTEVPTSKAVRRNHRPAPSTNTVAVPSNDKNPATKQEQDVNHSGRRAERTGSAPLPGSPPVEPNTTVLRKKRGAWALPLQILPSGLQRREAPPLPENLRLALPAEDPGKQ